MVWKPTISDMWTTFTSRSFSSAAEIRQSGTDSSYVHVRAVIDISLPLSEFFSSVCDGGMRRGVSF